MIGYVILGIGAVIIVVSAIVFSKAKHGDQNSLFGMIVLCGLIILAIGALLRVAGI